ncbi:MAG TPA: hypothetical protein VFK85_02450 [Anaeromyxobacteraceae bacterium]|nr:hypothetical protein [Anaeromyxobacteraceae bacterium]
MVRDCLRYAFAMDPDVARLGLSFENEQDAAFAADPTGAVNLG